MCVCSPVAAEDRLGQQLEMEMREARGAAMCSTQAEKFL